MTSRYPLILLLVLNFVFAGLLSAQTAKPERPPEVYDASVPKATFTEVRYGDHERHVLDFWKAESNVPTPVAFVIHGGGWSGGSKERLHRFADANALLEAGISVVAINYRYVPQAVEAGSGIL